jgi:rhodanese-related sulfurtransferase/DNA-binding transcriptional ArsR family regulator
MKNPNRRFKEAVYEQFARISKALSSPRRLELLDLLCQGPRTVEALAEAAGMSVANTSQHLRALRLARLVEASKEGQFVTYSLADEAVCEFYHTLRHLAERRLAEVEQIVQQYLAQRELLEPVDQEQLLSQVRGGEVVVLDVRPPEEYRAGHIPGALSVPLEELEQRLSRLPRRRQVVAYCRGPYCVLAVEAVALLRRRGFKAVRLEAGVHDWRRRGYRVAVGEQP